MRLHSTPESADKLEPTWLAIFESALAVGILLALAYWQGSVWVFVPSLLLAPLALMSTPRAGVISLRLFDRWANYWSKRFFKYRSRFRIIKVIISGIFLLFLDISAIFIRLIGAIVAFSLKPSRSLKIIPANFVRIVLSIDILHFPEIFRGVENKESISHRYKKDSIANKYRFFSFFSQIKGGAFVLPASVLCILYLPAFFYRLSLKSSALFWLPIIWIASQVRESGSAQLRTTRIRTLPLQPVMRIWSGVVLLLFSAKLWLWWRWAIWRDGWNAYFPDDFSLRLTNQLVWPDGLPLWHIATVVNALLSLGLWLWACSIDIDLKHEVKISDRRVNNSINTVNTIRTAITCYVLACTVYIVVSTAMETKFPLPDIIVAPWSERGELPASRPLMDPAPADEG